MKISGVLSTNNNLGYTLIELIVVVSMVAILGAASLPVYQRMMDRADRASVQLSANRFSTTVGLLHAQWLIEKHYPTPSKKTIHSLDSESIQTKNSIEVIYNENGWPFDAKTQSGSQEVFELGEEKQCERLWDAIIENKFQIRPHQSSTENIKEISKGPDKNSNYVIISAKKMHTNVCRFTLIMGHREPYFFDYHLMDGRVETYLELLD